MKRANRSDIYNEFKIEVANSSETLVKRTEIHVFIFLKTVLFRADWIRCMIAIFEPRILCTDKKKMYVLKYKESVFLLFVWM
jgi:hypothetical protein